MSYYNKKQKNTSKYPITMTISHNLNKHGEIKVKGNKKKTKELKEACTHHKYTKKGKLHDMLYRSEGKAYCVGCGEYIRTEVYTNDEIRKLRKDMITYFNQNKFLVLATNASPKIEKFYGTFGMMLKAFFKTSKKVNKVAQRQSDYKKRKKKETENTSQSFGSWQTTKR